MTEFELRKLFKNKSDCYVDNSRFENDGSYTEGEVVQGMTEDKFIEVIKYLNLLDTTIVKELYTCIECGHKHEFRDIRINENGLDYTYSCCKCGDIMESNGIYYW